MEIDELKPAQDKVVQIQQVHERHRAHQIFLRPGQKCFSVNKKTLEVLEVKAEVSHIQKIPLDKFDYELMRHKADGNPVDFFYTAAINKKNALRHYNQWLNL